MLRAGLWLVVTSLGLPSPATAAVTVETRDYRIVLGDDGLPRSWHLVGPWAELIGETSIVLFDPPGDRGMLALDLGSEDASSAVEAAPLSGTALVQRRDDREGIHLVYHSWLSADLAVERSYRFPVEGLVSTLRLRVINMAQTPLKLGGDGAGPSVTLGPGVGGPPASRGELAGGFYNYVRPAFRTDHELVSSTLHPEEPTLAVDEVRWTALHNRYFAAALVPLADHTLDAEATLPREWAKQGTVDEERLRFYPITRLRIPPAELRPGESTEIELRVFFGPKTRQTLRGVGGPSADPAHLDDLLFPALWDWLRWLCFALMAILRGLYGWLGDWGVAILALALAVRLVTLPIAQMGLRQQERTNAQQAALKPQIQEIKEKYKDDSAQETEAIVALYKEHGISLFAPLKGCLWIAVQIPIFVALFNLLGQAYELRGADFLWIEDLSKPDRLFPLGFQLPFLGSYFNLLPVIMAASQVLVTYLSTPQQPDSRGHGRTMIVLAAVFFFLFYTFPSGLVLYWTAANVSQLAQQMVTERWAAARFKRGVAMSENRKNETTGGGSPSSEKAGYDLVGSRADTAAESGPAGEGIRTVDVIRDLMRLPPEGLSKEDAELLDALIRKVHVAPRVQTTYGRRWSRVEGSAELPSRHWPDLVAALLHQAEAVDAADDVVRARALKSLNGAFAALAHSQGGEEDLERFERRASELLAQLRESLR